MNPSSHFELARPQMVGWRERAALPDLGIRLIKCKVDTGARTSSLHAFDVATFERNGSTWVRFGVHPRRRDDETEIWCESEILGERSVTNSGGASELRIVLRTRVRIGEQIWPIELNLTDRSTMGYRMLLGRTALDHRFLVDPSSSWLQGRPRKKAVKK
jgi:hypothetical protein